ncbi:MAG: ABC transporter permease [Deltaproteobacteria bacterium]|nr:ABC transporter permease [Deltaproteobacteria bacterium]
MKLEWALAFRYLRSRHRESSLSLATALAVVGVMLGVAALLVAMSLMNGYRHNVVQVMAGAMPHLYLISYNVDGSGGFGDEALVREQIQQRLNPRAITPFLIMDSMLTNPAAMGTPVRGVMIRGVATAQEAERPDFLQLLQEGAGEVHTLSQEQRLASARRVAGLLAAPPVGRVFPVLISPTLAAKLLVHPGDQLVPLRFPKKGENFNPRPMDARLEVVGYFETGILSFDEMAVMMDLNAVQAMFHLESKAHSLGVFLDDPMAAMGAAEAVSEIKVGKGEDFTVSSWLETNRGMFQLIQTQKVALGLVLMVIVVVAFFGMVSALVMLVVEKTREIAGLKALGMKDSTVRKMFFWQGVLIGVGGLTLGIGLGLGVLWVLDTFPLVSIPAGVYPGSDRIPVLVDWRDIVVVAVATLGVSMTATWYPANKAMALKPVDGLRSE